MADLDRQSAIQAVAATGAPLLQLHELSISYGHNPALQRVSFSLRRGQSLAVAGSNGAGKTSLLGALAGLAVPQQHLRGSLEFDGRQYQLGDSQRGIRESISLVPERAKVFSLLTVDENLKVGARGSKGQGLSAADIFSWFPRLGERRTTLAGNLSGGEQQMLGIALSLMSSPSLLLLDEPTLGLAIPVIDDLCQRLDTLRHDLELSVIVAESDSQWLPRLARRAVVIDRGALVREFDTLQAHDLDQIHDLMLGINTDSATGGTSSEQHFHGVCSHA